MRETKVERIVKKGLDIACEVCRGFCRGFVECTIVALCAGGMLLIAFSKFGSIKAEVPIPFTEYCIGIDNTEPRVGAGPNIDDSYRGYAYRFVWEPEEKNHDDTLNTMPTVAPSVNIDPAPGELKDF